MGTIEKGAYEALHNCLRLKKNESIVIITDVETLEIGTAFMTEAKTMTSKVKFYILEDFGERPLQNLPKEIKTAVKNCNVGVYVAQGREGELQTIRKPMLALCDESDIRFAHMINIDQTMMEQGMCSDYKKIQSFSEKLYSLVKGASSIRVTTKLGTDFTAEFSEDIKWVNADGKIEKHHWSNLPDGELYTCPANVNGRVVVDGVLGDYFAAKFGLIESHPLVVDIKGGTVMTARCDNKEIEDEFREYINTDENAKRVGEFALGTNLELNELIGKLLQDEKYPGVHIAFGDGRPHLTKAPWKSEVHLDAVIKKPTVYVDGKIIMENGEYLI